MAKDYLHINQSEIWRISSTSVVMTSQLSFGSEQMIYHLLVDKAVSTNDLSTSHPNTGGKDAISIELGRYHADTTDYSDLWISFRRA